MSATRRPRPGIQPETYMPPPTIIPSTVRPNIRPIIRPHSECWQLTFLPGGEWWGRPGDVRVCIHGKVQVRTEVGPNARIAGPGTDWWRTLSRFWDRREYKRAIKALEQ